MAIINQVEGVRDVLNNLNRANQRIAEGISRGLRLAGLTLQRESQKLVPVDFGVLKNSAFTRVVGQGYGTVVSVGYTASYAMFVHEKVGMKLKGQPRPGGRGRYWDPQGRAQAKFIEEPSRRLAPELVRIIQQNAAIT